MFAAFSKYMNISKVFHTEIYLGTIEIVPEVIWVLFIQKTDGKTGNTIAFYHCKIVNRKF